MEELEYKNSLGRKIKQIRNSLNLTQESFCNEINLEISNLSNIENGKSYPSLQTLNKIITTFKIEPNELFNISFYDKPEVVKQLAYEYFDKLPANKQVMVLLIIMLINQDDKN